MQQVHMLTHTHSHTHAMHAGHSHVSLPPADIPLMNSTELMHTEHIWYPRIREVRGIHSQLQERLNSKNTQQYHCVFIILFCR